LLQVIAAASEFAAKPRAVPMDLDNPGTPRQVGSTCHPVRSGASGLAFSADTSLQLAMLQVTLVSSLQLASGNLHFAQQAMVLP
jgi:hypothetical protein